MCMAQNAARKLHFGVKCFKNLSGNMSSLPLHRTDLNAQAFFVSACEQAMSGDIKLVNFK